ncbi:MAG: hypothetical protein IJZ29_05950 [Clostridia bacterium]|nr:hypothetical protein [Clostridia bacterium]
MNVEDQKSLIWNVIAFTLAVIALIFIVICAILAVFFPKNYGDLLFSVGLKNVSLSAYEYHYQTTDDINDLYLLLNKSISANNDEFIVKAYENLERQEDYYEFIEFKENQFLNQCASTLEMLYLSNEDNYLKGKYVVALKKFKGSDVAFEYAYNNLKNANISSSGDRINFVLGYYISSLKKPEQFEYFTTTVKNDIYNYFNSLYAIYESEISNLTVPDNTHYLLDKFNLLKLNYRLTDVYYAMTVIETAVGMENDMQALEAKALELSNDFVSLI